MPLRIFNTLTGTKEEFIPLKPNEVSMYVCGVTVYDLCHLGHARGAIVFDVIRRYLEYKGYKVNYIRNFTDIDDKIIKKAHEESRDWQEVARTYIAEYYRDMEIMNVPKATLEPKATDHIFHMINIIKALLDKGYAYGVVDGDIYFAIDKFSCYGKLSGRSLSEMLAGARVEVDDKKRNPLDFVLWKKSKPGEPKWESPWGEGRPGWHIECSAMSIEYLSETFDIHGGGKDLIFPHHENEIAQSEAFTGEPFVRYWIHNGFVNVNQEKMSKSLGNFFTIRELTNLHKPETIRFFLLSTHYRTPIDFSLESLSHAQKGLDRFYTMLERLDDFLGCHGNDDTPKSEASDVKISRGPSGNSPPKKSQQNYGDDSIASLESELEQTYTLFQQAMDDDFNTAQAISRLFDLTKAVNTALDKASLENKDTVKLMAKSRRTFSLFGSILGVFQMSSKEWFQARQFDSEGRITPQIIEQMIAKRDEARKKKSWTEADKIREELLQQGIVLEDSPKGTTWKYKN